MIRQYIFACIIILVCMFGVSYLFFGYLAKTDLEMTRTYCNNSDTSALCCIYPNTGTILYCHEAPSVKTVNGGEYNNDCINTVKTDISFQRQNSTYFEVFSQTYSKPSQYDYSQNKNVAITVHTDNKEHTYCYSSSSNILTDAVTEHNNVLLGIFMIILGVLFDACLITCFIGEVLNIHRNLIIIKIKDLACNESANI